MEKDINLPMTSENIHSLQTSGTEEILISIQGDIYRLREHWGTDESGNTQIAASHYDAMTESPVGSTKYITLEPGQIAEILTKQSI